MITITNPRIAGFAPRWAAFRGFTYLFDNPASSYTLRNGLDYVDCAVQGDEKLHFYRGLWQGLASLDIDALTHQHLFCPLASASYHVTACDGVNDSNLAQVVTTEQAACAEFLDGLPASLPAFAASTPFANVALVSEADWAIRLRLERVEKWFNFALVARLAAADAPSEQALQRLIATREQVAQEIEHVYGVRPGVIYTPHTTLGYFANRDLAEAATPLVETWSEQIAEKVAGLTLEVHTIRLYGFTDLENFFALPH